MNRRKPFLANSNFRFVYSWGKDRTDSSTGAVASRRFLVVELSPLAFVQLDDADLSCGMRTSTITMQALGVQRYADGTVQGDFEGWVGRGSGLVSVPFESQGFAVLDTRAVLVVEGDTYRFGIPGLARWDHVLDTSSTRWRRSSFKIEDLEDLMDGEEAVHADRSGPFYCSARWLSGD